MQDPTSGAVSHWIFQGNPDRYDLREELSAGTTEHWLVTRYATRIKADDVVWFWRSGERAIYGWGRVLEPAQLQSNGKVRAPVACEVRFEQPVSLDEMRADPALANLMPLRAPQGTNFAVTRAEADALIAMTRAKSYPVPESIQDSELAPLVPANVEALRLIEKYVSSRPTLLPSVIQVVDVLAAIHDTALGRPDTDSGPDDFSGWLREVLTGTLQPGSRDSDANRLFNQVDRTLEPELDARYRDEGVTADLAEKAASSTGLFLSPALAESIDRAIQMETRLAARQPGDDRPTDFGTIALIIALLFSSWPAVRHLLVQLRLGRTVSDIRRRFRSHVEARFGSDEVTFWEQFTRLGAADLVRFAYSPDTTSGDDALNIMPDVQAFASVIASRRIDPPLSIGLFGDWGSGKSFFMSKLKGTIEDLAKSARMPSPNDPNELVDNPESEFLPNIVQVEFNAWHYVDSNLWASLVSHLFDNLRVDEEDSEDVLKGRRNRLIKDMDVAARLKAAAEDDKKAAEEQLEQKRKTLSKLQQQRASQRVALSFENFRHILSAQSYKDVLSANAVAAIETASSGDYVEVRKAYGEVSDGIEEAKSLLGKSGKLARGFRRLGWYNAVWVVVILLVILALEVVLPLVNFDVFDAAWGDVAAFLGIAAVWLKTAVEAASKGIDRMDRIREKLAEALDDLKPPPSAVEVSLDKDIVSLESQLAVAEKQVAQAAERAEAAEAELVEVDREASVAQFIEDRAASGDYREKLGLLALVRRDFDQLSRRMKRVRREGRLLSDPERIDRIVLYIDDLDRCPPERVFDVLQAIHLLLAFDLFVVVVGVDEGWLTRALALARAGLIGRRESAATDTDAVLERMKIPTIGSREPADFLEKIFQIGYWLKPMDERGFDRMLGQMLFRDRIIAGDDRPLEPEVVVAAEAEPSEIGTVDVANSPATDTVAEEQRLAGNEPDEDSQVFGMRSEAVAITETEASVIRALSPVVGRSPRTAKRYVNLYRVLKARELIAATLNPLRDEEYLGGMMLLAVIVGHPRGTERFISEIENAGTEIPVRDFINGPEGKWEEGAAARLLPRDIARPISEVVARHLDQLRMMNLQHWLPTARRFSFRSGVARLPEYENRFSSDMPLEQARSASRRRAATGKSANRKPGSSGKRTRKKTGRS